MRWIVSIQDDIIEQFGEGRPYYSIDLFEKEQYQYNIWQMQQSSMQQSTVICSKELLCQTQHESDCFSIV